MNKKGFTLTELIVVIVIIGLVLLIVIPVSSNIMQNNAEEKGKFYVQTLENAVNTYCDMYKTNNVTLEELTSEGLFKTDGSNGVSTDLTEATFETAHGGYDPVYANQDADRVLPVDIITELLAEGKIGSMHKYYYSTVGNGTAVANALKYAKEIGEKLVEDHVDAVILTST